MEDYEELMLQISDVMRQANRIRPGLSHEQAVKNIRGIVERHGEWIYDEKLINWKCSECFETPKTIGYVGSRDFMNEHFKYCNHCGARMVR